MTKPKIVNRSGKRKPKYQSDRRQANELGLTVAELQQARNIVKAVDLVGEAYRLVGEECFREIVAAAASKRLRMERVWLAGRKAVRLQPSPLNRGSADSCKEPPVLRC